ncbi:MAG: Spy/CpxP family protein refolding chaperone [Nannocystales bacterium]
MNSLLRATAFSLPLLLGVSSTALAAAPDALAQTASQGKKGKKGKAGKQARGLCAQLSCTDAQSEQVGAHLQALRERQSSARVGQQALNTSLSRELAKNKPSKKELARIQKDLARTQAKMTEATLSTLLDIHALLDPTQRQRLSSMVERGGLRRLFKGPRAGHGPGSRKRRGGSPPTKTPI